METVLSYYDSLLTKDDVGLLKQNNWLNDKLLGFSFEYFERDVFKQWADDVTFVSPDVTQFIKMAPDSDIEIFLEPLSLKDRQLVFFAVNDNIDVESTGGSHWSLLFFNRALQEMHHYDSMSSANGEDAKMLAKKVSKYVNPESNAPGYKEQITPQQQNCCDCGVYAICIAEYLCNVQFQNLSKGMDEVVTPDYVKQYRQKLQDLIKTLAAQSRTD